jgi:hypothetical protein
MNDPDLIRADIVGRLGAVLPGRAFMVPPTSGRYVTPSLFVEQITIGGDMTEPVGTFPVWVVTDGSVEAQIEAHDRIVWNTWLALYPLSTRLVARPVVLAGLRATVVEADIPIDAFGMCGAPDPAPYQLATIYR